MSEIMTAEQKIIDATRMVVDDGEMLTFDDNCTTGRHLFRAFRAGQNWDVKGAEEALDRVYASVGEVNEYTGMAWHQGKHPLQLAIAATSNTQ